MSEGIEEFISPVLFFVVPLLIVILIKFGYKLKNKKFSYKIPENSSKYGYFILVIVLILCILATSPIAGQGYDTPFFVFNANHIRENGLLEIFQTDRPLTYFLTDIIGWIFNVPGRVSIPISSVVFTTFYVVSIFVLALTLTKNTLLATMSSLLAVGSNMIRLSALCFVGNILGFAFLYLFFSVVIKFYETGRKLHLCLSVVIFICIFFSHFITSLIAIIILIFLFSYLLIINNQRNLVHLGICILSCFILLILCTVSYAENLIVLSSLVNINIGGGMFLQYLAYDWSSDYLWIFLFTIVGAWVTLFECKLSEKFLTAWTVGLIILLFFSSVEASRIILYLPFSILSSIGIYFVINQYFKRNTRKIFIYTLIFLMLVPSVYYIRMQHMNIKYYEEGPFFWDTKFLETEQLKWIKNNYNTNSIVVLTDLSWNPDPISLNEKGLIAGVHYRILAKIGNNVYFGNLSDLLLEKPDIRGNTRTILGTYSSLNIDWTLKNKTILIPTTIYKISDNEKEICYNITDGIYVIKSLTEEEKQVWLKKNG